MTVECPVAYDHTDNLDECFVCGWTEFLEPANEQESKPLTGPERIREAIKILNGGYAPRNPALICGPVEPRPVDELDRSFATYQEGRNAE